MSYDSQTSSTLINKLRKDVDSLTLKVAVLTDSKPSGTSGGSGVATTWSTRNLNTIESDPNGLILDLTSNQFKLAAGAYQIRAMAALLHTGHTRMRIYDVTASAEAGVDVIIGYGVSVEVSNQSNTYNDINVRVQPHKDNVYRLEYYISAAGADHLGVAAGLTGIPEIYAICEITRLDTGLTKPSGGSGIQGAPGPAGPVGPAGPPGPAGSGTVTNVSVVTANGVSGSVATSTTTPAITLALGAITPTSVTASGAISAGATVTGSNLSGVNTGDQVIILSGDRMLSEGSDFLITESGDYILETGDVTGQGTGRIPAVITPQAVTYDKMQYVSATDRLLGRQSAGPGLIEEITCTAAGRALLDDASAADQRTTLGAAASGPITASGLTIGTNNRLVGRSTSGGAVEEISLGSGISFAGTVLSATGTGGTVTDVTVTASNGITASVGTSTTTPAISLGLGAITPTSVASTGTVTGTNISGSTSGANTGDQTITLTGPVTGSGTGSFATTITNGAVTYDKIQTAAAIKRLLGSDATGNSIGEINLGANLSMVGNTLSASAPGTGTVTSVNADASTTGMSFTGGPVTTSGTLTLGGTLALTNGGTGATSAAAALTSLGAYPATNPNNYNVGTVTTASVTTANGVSGTVANPTSTPAITIVLGAIVPTSVAASGTVTGSNLSGTHTGTSSGTNTGDQAIVLSGDVSGSGSTGITTTIGANKVTYGKIQVASATSRLLGSSPLGTAIDEIILGTGLSMAGNVLNSTASGSGDVTGPSVSVDGDVAVFNGTTGKIIKVGATTGTGNLVRATSATLTNVSLLTPNIGTPSGGTLTNCTFPVRINDTGITCSTARVLGRSTAGTGSVEQLTLGAGLSLTAGVLNTTGSGSGDVVGPSSANTNALAKFSSTTGKLIGEAAWSENGADLYGVAGYAAMTYGYVWIPSGTGTPSTPAQYGALSGRAPMYFDRSTNQLFIFNESVPGWKSVTLT